MCKMDAPLSARRAKPHIARSTEKRVQIIVETVQVEQYARRVKLCKGYEGNDETSSDVPVPPGVAMGLAW